MKINGVREATFGAGKGEGELSLLQVEVVIATFASW